jgi:hypothetical protein
MARPSGIPAAREAVAAEYTANGFPVSADRVFITAGTSEGIELTLSAVIDGGGEVLVPMPTYPLYTAVLAKLDAKALYYRLDSTRGWMPDLDHLKSLVTPATRALVVIDPNNPTGAVYPVETRRALIEFADRHGLLILADESMATSGSGAVPPYGLLDPDAPIISFSSLSRRISPGWRTLDGGRPLTRLAMWWLRCGSWPMVGSAAPCRCGTIAPALTGDRSHGVVHAIQGAPTHRGAPARDAGVSYVAPTAAFYAMPRVALRPGARRRLCARPAACDRRAVRLRLGFRPSG